MNKHFYRVVFNRARGMLVVVAELIKRHQGAGRSSSKAKSVRSTVTLSTALALNTLTVVTYLTLGWVSLIQPSFANTIVVDNSADKTQRPVVTTAANGVSQINIQTPSKAGVSHNKFTQFDVTEKGVILNNSAQMSQTQLGGYIKGNDFLVPTGGAKIILNEVNAKNASQLNGYIEVAGQKAQVVIANAAGITCNGCGFINADRATLTTGKPILDNGQLKGYLVEKGNIAINGKGLDSAKQTYTDLIARSVSINASLWANEANVITGKNKVSTDLSQIEKQASDETDKPALAIDVAALGGMYAGKIQMVGTESGVGVHNAGKLGASAGGITITADGKIVNSGVMDSQGDLQVKTSQQIENKGKLLSGHDIALQSAQGVNQQGHVIAANHISVKTKSFTQSSDGITAAGTAVTGERLAQGNLTVITEQDVKLQGQVQASGKSHIKGRSIDANTVNLNSQSLALEASDGNVDVSHAQIRVDNDATLTAKQTVNAEQATVSTGELYINSQTVNNVKGTLASKNSTQIKTDRLINQSGQLLSQGQLTLSGQTGALSQSLDNMQGNITSLGSMEIASDTLTGDGKIESGQDMLLTLASNWLNQQTIHANGNLTINAQGGTDNLAAISAGEQLILNTQALYNQQTGDIQGKNTALNATNLLNHGVIDGELTNIHATELKNEDNGRIYGDKVVINTQTLINQKNSESTVAPVIAGRENLFIGVNNLLNKDHALLLSGGDLEVGAKATEDGVTGYSQEIDNHSASIEATGNITLSTNTFDNRDLYLKLSDTPIEVDRKSFHEFEWCQGDKAKEGCVGGNGKRYLVQDRNGNERREIIDENGNVTGEGYISYNGSRNIRFIVGGEQTKHFYEYFYDKVTYETQIEHQDPAKIQAGKNLVINANIATNQNSQLLAGQSMTINATQFNNLETKGERWVKEQDSIGHEGQGRVSYYKSGDSDWKTKTRTSSYQGKNTTEALSLGTLKVADNTATLPATTIDEKQGVSALPPAITQYPTIVPVTLPNNAIYQIRPGKDSNYLVETDPRFTNRKKWISSLDVYDANNVQKRLGDGYYEQSLIKDQILAATGNQYLSGYEDSNEQYRDLLVAGNLYAKTYQLTPGIALTTEQMAALTTNMVWMVNQAVTLPNGDVEIVSVPKLYLAGDQTALTQQGSLVHAGKVTINTQDDLNNQGVINGDTVNINSHNINNTGTIAGGSVALKADQDIINTGGKLQAQKSLDAQAGRDFVMTTEQHQDGKERWLDSVSTVYVSDSEGKLHLSGQRDMVLTAGNIINLGKETTLDAGRDIKLETQTTSHATDYTYNSKNYDRRESQEDVGTSITTVGDLSINAGHDVAIKAGDISSQGNMAIKAGNDIAVTTGDASFDHSASSTWSKKSLLSKTKTTSRSEEHNKTAISSNLSGENVTLSAGNDLSVSGSQVTSTKDMNVAAGGNVDIDAAEESYYSKTQTITKKSGMMSSGGLGVTIGKETTDLKQTDTQQGYQASTIGSTEGNVTITAGKDIKVQGSDIIAKQDVNLTGENVDIAAKDSETKYKEEYKYEKSGLTLAVTGTAADIYDAAKAVDNAKKKDNDTLLALQSIKAGLTAVQAAQDLELKNKEGQPQASIGVSASIGSQKTERVVNQEQHNVVSSGVSAGDNITITATGDSQKAGGNINVIGSEVKAGQDITLNANNDVNVIGAVNTQHSDKDEKSTGSSVGIQLQFGGDESGFRFKGNANFSQERENANGSAWTEGVVDAGKNLNIKTGNDANIVGGQLKGESVKAEIGNNLNIQSLQDTDNYDYEKLSGSVGGSAGFGGGSLNVALDQTKMNSKWASVTDQSGIYAGKDGFDITVGNNTDLKGAVIASTAEDKSKNKLDTGTISFEDIKNKADFNVSHVSVSVGTSMSGSPTPGAPSIYQNSGSDSSTTKSAVEGGTLIVRDGDKQTQNVDSLSRDTANANNPLGQIFDKQKEQDKMDALDAVRDIAAQAKEMTNKYDRLQAQKEIDKNGIPDEIKNAAKNDYNSLSDEDKAKYQDFADYYNQNNGQYYYAAVDNQVKYNKEQGNNAGGIGSSVNKGIDAATSIISGIISGDVTGGLADASAPYLAEQIKMHTGHYNPEKQDWDMDDKAANLIAHAILGGAVAAVQGNSALAGAGGAAGGEAIADVIRNTLYDGRPAKDLTEEEKQNISNLAQLAAGLATAAAGGSTSDAATAASASKNSVENNAIGVVVTPAGPVLVPIIIPGVNDANANEQIALALENALKNMGKTIKDILNPDGSIDMNAAEAILSPEQQAQLKAQIIKEREGNQIALGKPLVQDMNEYLTTNENGQFLKERTELVGYDAGGNPVYKATSGAGNFINADDQIKLSGSKDALLVYDKNGICIGALNLDGSRNDTLTAIYKGGNLSTINDKPIPNNTGGNQIPTPLPPLPGLVPPENLAPNNTGHGDGLDNIEIQHDTGGNQIPEAIPALPGYQMPDNDWRDNIYTSENGDPAFKNGYVWKPNIDEDLRGSGLGFQDALDKAFGKLGVDKSEFTVTKWAVDKNGKSYPVEYRVVKGQNKGAEVNIDVGHDTYGPGVPHIGFQTPGKNNTTGHILIDDVPVNRSK